MKFFKALIITFSCLCIPFCASASQKFKSFQIEDFELAMQGPVTRFVFMIKDNVFLNTESKTPSFLETLGNAALSPVHYLFQANLYDTSNAGPAINLGHVFDYTDKSPVKTWASVIATPSSLILGSCLKGLSLLMHKEARNHNSAISLYFKDKTPPSKANYNVLEKCNLAPFSKQRSMCLNLPKGPLVHPNIKNDIKALKEIAKIFKKYNIPFWLDDGTCLGAYRHAGLIAWDYDVDLSILQADFENAKAALKELDPELYILQDWSGSDRPKSYLRVFVKENASLIDVYTYDISAEKGTVRYIFSLENSFFIPEKWKSRERKLMTPKPISWLFPLKKASFEGVEVYVPNQIEKWLQSKYGKDISPARIWDEKKQQYLKVEGHPYWETSPI